MGVDVRVDVRGRAALVRRGGCLVLNEVSGGGCHGSEVVLTRWPNARDSSLPQPGHAKSFEQSSCDAAGCNAALSEEADDGRRGPAVAVVCCGVCRGVCSDGSLSCEADDARESAALGI